MTVDYVELAKENLANFYEKLGKYLPDPTTRRLMEPDAVYSPADLRSMLQEYSSYISNLSALKGKMDAEQLILERGYKLMKMVLMGSSSSSAGTLQAREAEILASEEGAPLLQIQQNMILSESCILIVKSWLEAYESGYAGVSRVVATFESESDATGGNQRYT